MRALWSLPKAAPALLRHVAAYVELLSLDVARARREIGAILIAAVIAAVSGMFCILLGCLALIAYYWDTRYRMAAIGGLAGAFLVLAIIMLMYSLRLSRSRSPFLGDLRREWREDKVIVEHALSPDEE